MEKTAIVFGATGLVGSHLIDQLIKDDRYNQIKVFTRREIGKQDPKIKEYMVDLFDLKSYSEYLTGNDLFYCIGTTAKKTKSKEQYRETEYQLPLNIAKATVRNDIDTFILVSSIGANGLSRSFYLKNKGELEDVLMKLSLKNLIILRPSLLLGKRNEFRIWEEIGKILYKIFGLFFLGKLKKYKAIKAEDVATCMIKIANMERKKKIFECNELIEILKN